MGSSSKRVVAIVLAAVLVFTFCAPVFAFNYNTDNAVFFGNQGFSTDWLFRPGYSAADEAAVNAALTASGTGGVTFLLNGKLISYTDLSNNTNATGLPATAAALAEMTVKDQDGNTVTAVDPQIAIKADAEAAVAAYEAAPVTTLEEVTAAEALEEAANAKIALVNNAADKEALENRVTVQKAKVDAAKAALESPEDTEDTVVATLTNGQILDSVVITITVNDNADYPGVAKYQVLDDNGAADSAKVALGTSTNIFTPRNFGDNITIKFFDNAGQLVGTKTVKLTEPAADPADTITAVAGITTFGVGSITVNITKNGATDSDLVGAAKYTVTSGGESSDVTALGSAAGIYGAQTAGNTVTVKIYAVDGTTLLKTATVILQ